MSLFPSPPVVRTSVHSEGGKEYDPDGAGAWDAPPVSAPPLQVSPFLRALQEHGVCKRERSVAWRDVS